MTTTHIDSSKRTHNAKPVGITFSALTILALAVSSVMANDWGPYLGPSFPDESGSFTVIEDEFVPATISGSRSAKQLPSMTERRSSRNTGRQAAFEAPPEPDAMIIPQSFFEDDPGTSGAEHPTAPKTLKKNRLAIETGNGSYSGHEMSAASHGIILNDGETIVNEFTFGDDAYYMADASGMQTGGVYDDCSPALNGYYASPMMMKSFGSGVLDNLTIFGGVAGFKSELDAGRNGNFGFQEGINWSGPATPQCTVSAQVGFRAIQSNINGNSGVSSKRSRNQYFVTAGLFKRDLAYPIQGGVVFDWMDDDFYGKVKVRQLRCELSARTFSNLEYGFLGGFGVSKSGTSFINLREDPTGTTGYGIEAQQYYLLFARKHFASGGVAEGRVGLTERGDTILSAGAEFPLSDRFTLNGGFTGMIPREGRGAGGCRRESWDISVGFVFYFRGGACSKPYNPCRPMFDVAGNGTFFNRIVRK